MKTLLYSKSIKTLLLALFTLSIFSISAQPINYMVMKKSGKKKRYTFIEGQEITLKTNGDIGYISDYIISITDSTIEFANNSISYSIIEKVKINKKKHLILPNQAALTYGTTLVLSAAVLETAYIINSGKGIHNLGTQLAVLSTPIPTIFISNWIYGLFVKTEYEIAPNEYQLYPIILRKE